MQKITATLLYIKALYTLHQCIYVLSWNIKINLAVKIHLGSQNLYCKGENFVKKFSLYDCVSGNNFFFVIAMGARNRVGIGL